MKKIIFPTIFAVAIFVIGLFITQDWRYFTNYLRAARLNQEIRISHPRLEAHRFLDQLAPAAVFYEWLPYYYRHPKPQETVAAIGVLLPQENVEPARIRAEIHFFAAILREHPEELDRLKERSRRYSGKQLERITAIIKETENYQPVKEISPALLESLWAEYMATGNKEIITRMIKGLESPDNPQLVQAIQDSLYRHLPLYSDADKVFNEAAKKTHGAFGSTLQEMKKVIHDTFAEPAQNHLIRADNHIKQREYERALDEFEESLKNFPDYPQVFINVANMYEAQGKRQEAMAAMKKAVQIDPDNPSACYGMGRHYFFQGNYSESINWYSKALKYQPQNPLYVHAVARSYQSNGDTANAVKYFQQYLQYAPAGEHVALVKRYLASLSTPVPAASESTTVLDAFNKKDYDTLEKRFANLLKEKQKDSDGNSLLAHAYEQICDNSDAKYSMDAWLGNFQAWLKNNPSSHFANAAIGKFYVTYAWHARGSGWANTVTEQGWRSFQERLLKAREYLEKAYLADPTDPLVPSQLIKVAMGLGMDYAEMEKQFQRAMRADRTEYSAYYAKLNYLMRKWHGSQEQMFSFARATARNAPSNSLAPLVLAKAHWEMAIGSGNSKLYFQQSKVWSEVKSVYSTLCRRFPKSRERHNWFAYTAYLAGDFQTAKKELAIIQDSWSPNVWGNYAKFIKARDEILRR